MVSPVSNFPVFAKSSFVMKYVWFREATDDSETKCHPGGMRNFALISGIARHSNPVGGSWPLATEATRRIAATSGVRRMGIRPILAKNQPPNGFKLTGANPHGTEYRPAPKATKRVAAVV